MKEAKIQIEIPNGKTAKWVNNVLTLVDKKPQNVMERIKTFEDARDELSKRAEHGDEDAKVLLDEYATMNSPCRKECSKDLLAYLKLRIINSVLNEGWKPKFIEGEIRWYPWFSFDRSRVVGRGGYIASANYGLIDANANSASSYSHTYYGSRLAFKSKELAEYAGKQFIDIYVDYLF